MKIHKDCQNAITHKLLAQILFELKKLNTLMEEGLREDDRTLDS